MYFSPYFRLNQPQIQQVSGSNLANNPETNEQGESSQRLVGKALTRLTYNLIRQTSAKNLACVSKKIKFNFYGLLLLLQTRRLNEIEFH